MATRQTCLYTQHATLSTTTADSVAFSGQGRSLAVTNRDSSATLYFSIANTSETQTLSLTAGLATQTFKLTFETVESSAVTLPTGGFANTTAAQILTALETIAALTGNVTVTKASNDYTILFGGALANADVGAITVTSKTGAADGSVAETTKGGCVSAADQTFVVLPLQTKVISFVVGDSTAIISLIGSGNAYSAELV